MDINNLKLSLDLAKEHLKFETERCARLDAKANFILVFIAALITGLNFIMPLPNDLKLHTASLVIVIEFLTTILATGITILIGMFPRTNLAIDEKNYSSAEINSKETEELFKGYLGSFSTAINSYSKTNAKKGKCVKIAFILSIFSFLLFCVLLLLKII